MAATIRSRTQNFQYLSLQTHLRSTRFEFFLYEPIGNAPIAGMSLNLDMIPFDILDAESSRIKYSPFPEWDRPMGCIFENALRNAEFLLVLRGQ